MSEGSLRGTWYLPVSADNMQDNVGEVSANQLGKRHGGFRGCRAAMTTEEFQAGNHISMMSVAL
jgi:hypothetical protein